MIPEDYKKNLEEWISKEPLGPQMRELTWIDIENAKRRGFEAAWQMAQEVERGRFAREVSMASVSHPGGGISWVIGPNEFMQRILNPAQDKA